MRMMNDNGWKIHGLHDGGVLLGTWYNLCNSSMKKHDMECKHS